MHSGFWSLTMSGWFSGDQKLYETAKKKKWPWKLAVSIKLSILITGWVNKSNKIWEYQAVAQLSIVQGWNKNGAVKTCNDCLRQFPNVNNNYSDPWGGALHTSSTIHGDMNTDIFYTFKYVHNQSKQISFLLFFIPISASYFVQRNILPI